LEGDIPYSVEGFIDPTPSDPIDKQDIIIWNLQKVDSDINSSHVDNSASFTLVNNNLQSLITQGSTGDSTLQGDTSNMLASLQSIQKSLDIQHDTNALVSTYGLIWFPLIMLVTMLWWFFRQFISSYK